MTEEERLQITEILEPYFSPLENTPTLKNVTKKDSRLELKLATEKEQLQITET